MRLENPVFSSNFVAYVSGDAVFCFNTPKISVLSAVSHPLHDASQRLRSIPQRLYSMSQRLRDIPQSPRNMS